MCDLLPILIACEYSDTVASAFRSQGFEAYSCDLRASESDPRRHPKYPSRMRGFLEGALLFSDLMAAPVEFIARENSKPHGLAMSVLGRPTQTVQPYDFGSPYTKGATLWLKNLPALKPTHTKAQVLEQHGVIEARCHRMPPTRSGRRNVRASILPWPQPWRINRGHILSTLTARRTFAAQQLEQAA